MNIKELIAAFTAEAKKLEKAKGRFEISIAGKYDNNGSIYASLMTDESGKFYIFGEATNENETHDTTFNGHPKVSGNLEDAVKGLIELAVDDPEATNLILRKVPKVYNDCYWIEPNRFIK